MDIDPGFLQSPGKKNRSSWEGGTAAPGVPQGFRSPYPPLQEGWECGASEAWQGQCCGHCPLSSQCNLIAITISSCTSFYQTLMITKNPTRGTCLPFWDTSHGRIIPFVLVQQSSPGMMERAALGSAHIRNQQGLENPSLGSAVLGGTSHDTNCWDFTMLEGGDETSFPIFWPIRLSSPNMEMCSVQFLHKEIHKLCPMTEFCQQKRFHN